MVVDVIVNTAMLITMSLLKLKGEQLELVLEANIAGSKAKGTVDYLIRIASLQVGHIGSSPLP